MSTVGVPSLNACLCASPKQHTLVYDITHADTQARRRAETQRQRRAERHREREVRLRKESGVATAVRLDVRTTCVQHTTYHQCAGMRGLVWWSLSKRRCRALSRSICTLPTLSIHSYARCESDPPLRTRFAPHRRRKLYSVSLCPQNTAKGCVAPRPADGDVINRMGPTSASNAITSTREKRLWRAKDTVQERDYFTSTPKTARAGALAGGWCGSRVNAFRCTHSVSANTFSVGAFSVGAHIQMCRVWGEGVACACIHLHISRL